jgi:hypothetical protein
MAYTQVFDLYGGFLLGYLGDLHLQGAMVIGNSSRELNSFLPHPANPNVKPRDSIL